jgi:hypothetical protein
MQTRFRISTREQAEQGPKPLSGTHPQLPSLRFLTDSNTLSNFPRPYLQQQYVFGPASAFSNASVQFQVCYLEAARREF